MKLIVSVVVGSVDFLSSRSQFIKSYIRAALMFGAMLALARLSLPLRASPLQPVSVMAAPLGPAAGGDGDSEAPIVGADGRSIVFASTADNLITNGASFVRLISPKLNVFLRDRTTQSTTLARTNVVLSY